MKKFFLAIGVAVILGGCATTPPIYGGVGSAGTQVLSTRQVLAGQPPLPEGMTEREALDWAREARQLENDRARNAAMLQEQERRDRESWQRHEERRQEMKRRAEEAKVRQISSGVRDLGRGLQDLARERQRARQR